MPDVTRQTSTEKTVAMFSLDDVELRRRLDAAGGLYHADYDGEDTTAIANLVRCATSAIFEPDGWRLEVHPCAEVVVICVRSTEWPDNPGLASCSVETRHVIAVGGGSDCQAVLNGILSFANGLLGPLTLPKAGAA